MRVAAARTVARTAARGARRMAIERTMDRVSFKPSSFLDRLHRATVTVLAGVTVVGTVALTVKLFTFKPSVPDTAPQMDAVPVVVVPAAESTAEKKEE